VRAGRGFRYRAPDGSPVDGETRRWIQRLAIPPAWTDVWISPDPDGHLLATGRDARGRKQYRYHPEYRRRRDDSKFERLAAFGAALPRLRRRVAIDLRRRGLPREKVLAALVALLDETSLRVGGEAYARVNRSYGLTTLGSRHAVVSAGAVRLRFRGKSGQLHDVRLRDRRLARLVRRCQELPGQRLSSTRPRTVAGRRSVRRRQRLHPGGDRRAVQREGLPHLARHAGRVPRLAGEAPPESARQRVRAVLAAIDEAAARLGNTGPSPAPPTSTPGRAGPRRGPGAGRPAGAPVSVASRRRGGAAPAARAARRSGTGP